MSILGSSSKTIGPVECLGRTFPSEEARREFYKEILREKLRDPEFRSIEGFPIGEDEDILNLSDPPYYTACPNPFIEEFVQHHGKPYDPEGDGYHREPFAADVSEGKNDPIYNAHSYHTKVPHKAIMRYILHYTEPGDVVYDGFCGTGMTGVAAQMCGDKAAVESLGCRVAQDGAIKDREGRVISRLGARYAVLNDLSPAATFIAYNYNTPVDAEEFQREAERILGEVEKECGWMYETRHTEGSKGRINYTVWSDVFTCPECAGEIVFWEAAVDKQAGRVRDVFECPHCNASLTKRKLERAWETKYDTAIDQTITQAKQVPVLINYSVGRTRYEKVPDAEDLRLIAEIEQKEIPYWYPTDRMPEGDESRRNDRIGITHVHHFYTKQNLWLLAISWNRFNTYNETRIKGVLRLSHTAANNYASKMRRFRADKKGGGPLSGTLYISSLITPPNVSLTIGRNVNFIKDGLNTIKFTLGNVMVSTNSSSDTDLNSSNFIDYIFTDPPFGGNLMYSEINFLWEAWLKVFTNNQPEAIENKAQGKGLVEYQNLMTQCFEQYYRALKPGRWMTVEFHNSQNKVWNSIQQALQHAGFVIADVRTLDKKQGSFKQVQSNSAVKQDLIISAYKPNGGLEERFKLEAGTEAGVWDFVRTHLRQLPRFVVNQGKVEVVAERLDYLLYDRMVAFHVQRGVLVPMSAAAFYEGLKQRFPCRDGMYFLPEQAAEYDRERMKVSEVEQLQVFVTDESSAIRWLREQLEERPQTFQDLQPKFMQETQGGWQKHEKRFELRSLLDENFICYNGRGAVPEQIVKYLEKQDKTLKGLDKEDPRLKAKAEDLWYVPDPNRAGDLEKLREKSLLREFEQYRQAAQRRLMVFRLEAVRAGFKKAWQEKDYRTIIQVAGKIPENVLQEDEKLTMWYDQALTRLEG